MRSKILNSLDDISSAEWNSLLEDSNPFLRHEFLAALERHDCVDKTCGWQPQHILIYDDSDQLIGASPLYIKYHSHGEFVFDWSWAEAYQRNNIAYYPKLISAIPFTPLTGQRLLTHPSADRSAVTKKLIETTVEIAQSKGLSSVHWLFPTDAEKTQLEQHGFSVRLGCQYHWHNHDYQDFEQYLTNFSSRKRKNIHKERQQVQKANVEFRVLHGSEIDRNQWQTFYHYYRTIYDRKWGYPSLTLEFFLEIGQTLAENIVLVMAYQQGKCIATALNLRSDHTLYGRHWGCADYVPALHFETCYYQGLDYCIEHGLKHFEPGAQGEHKIARGFLPTPTWSAHWIAHPGFAEAVNEFCLNEEREIKQVIETLNNQSPFRKNDSIKQNKSKSDVDVN